MVIDFVPQFHKEIAQSDGRNAWVAMPLPKTLIPAKTGYFRAWQREECLRLRKAGARVVVVASDSGVAAEADCGPVFHCQDRGIPFRTAPSHCA